MRFCAPSLDIDISLMYKICDREGNGFTYPWSYLPRSRSFLGYESSRS
jgi:hypothetical protein